MLKADPLVRLLQFEFDRMKSKNKRFSMRSLAKKIGIPVSTLSDLLNGKTSVSEKRATHILQKLGMNQKSVLTTLEEMKRTKIKLVRGKQNQEDYIELGELQSAVLSKWYFFAILALLGTNGSQNSSEWVAKRLRLNQSIVDDAFESLIRMNLLKLDENRNVVLTQKKSFTGSQLPASLIDEHHHQTLELAQQNLASKRESSNYSSITMAIDPARLSDAHEMITQFRRQLCAFLEAGEKKEVYRLAIQLFPLSI